MFEYIGQITIMDWNLLDEQVLKTKMYLTKNYTDKINWTEILPTDITSVTEVVL